MTGITRITRTTLMAVLVATGVLLAGCRTPDASSFANLHVGMDQEEVAKLLGPPSSSWSAPPPLPGDPPRQWNSRWHYGDTLSTTASAAIGPDIAPDEVWVIRFDDDGKVVDFRVPIQNEYAFPHALPPK